MLFSRCSYIFKVSNLFLMVYLTELIHYLQIKSFFNRHQILVELKNGSKFWFSKHFWMLLLTWTKQAIFCQELPFCHCFPLHTFASIFLSLSVMELLNMQKGKGKRNNSLKARREKSFSPGLLLKIGQPVTMILSVFPITVVATASF